MPAPIGKISLVLCADLEVWKKLNVTAFLVSGIVGAHPELLGQPYRDSEGHDYNRLLTQPVTVLAADSQTMRAIHRSALECGLRISLFVEGMFQTSDDDSNRRVVRETALSDMQIVGLGLSGESKAVTRATKGARLHP